MESDFCCRLCQKDMRVAGVLQHCTTLFQSSTQALSVSERLQKIGVNVSNTPRKPNRVCRACTTVLNRLERDLPIYWRWIANEVEEGASAESTGAEKRAREPTPSKTQRELKKLRHSTEKPEGSVAVRRNIAAVS